MDRRLILENSFFVIVPEIVDVIRSKIRLGRPQANLCSDAARPLQRSNLKPPWNADPWNAPNFWPAAGGNFLGFVSVSLTKSTAETVFQYIEIVVSTMIT